MLAANAGKNGSKRVRLRQSKRVRQVCRGGAALLTLLALPSCQLIMGDIPAEPDLSDAEVADADAEVEDAALMDAGGDLDATTSDEPDAEPGLEDGDVGSMDALLPDAEEQLPDADLPDVPVTLDPAACDGAGETVFFFDGDNDSYGVMDQFMVACSAPQGYVDRAGDCNDGNPDVRPGQTQYFGQGYPTAQGDSFDYDCDRREMAAPGQMLVQPCSGGGLLTCSGGGYEINDMRTPGPGVNVYCGSNALSTCGSVPLLGGCGKETVVGAPFRCR